MVLHAEDSALGVISGDAAVGGPEFLWSQHVFINTSCSTTWITNNYIELTSEFSSIKHNDELLKDQRLEHLISTGKGWIISSAVQTLEQDAEAELFSMSKIYNHFNLNNAFRFDHMNNP